MFVQEDSGGGSFMMIYAKSKGISNYFEISDVDVPDNYEAKMLLHNKLEFIPPLEISEFDGERNLYIKIDGLSVLANRYGKSIPTMEEVKSLVIDLKNCLREMRRFLLRPDNLIIDIKYILFDSENSRHIFPYVPGSNKSFKEQIKALFEEIMVMYDHKDREGVVYLYDLYSKFLGENFTPEMFCKLFNDEEKKRPQSNIDIESIEVLDEPINEEMDDEEKSPQYPLSLYVSAAIATLIIGLILFIFFGIPSLKFSALMVVALIVYVASDVISLREKKEIDEVMEPRVIREPAVQSVPVVKEISPRVEEEKDTTMLTVQQYSNVVSKLVPLNEGEEIYLIEGETRIGRKKTMCDYYINDPSVSRVHAILEKRGETVMLSDAGSTNGTYLNERRLGKNEKIEAARGDVISIAEIQFECC